MFTTLSAGQVLDAYNLATKSKGDHSSIRSIKLLSNLPEKNRKKMVSFG